MDDVGKKEHGKQAGEGLDNAGLCEGLILDVERFVITEFDDASDVYCNATCGKSRTWRRGQNRPDAAYVCEPVGA